MVIESKSISHPLFPHIISYFILQINIIRRNINENKRIRFDKNHPLLVYFSSVWNTMTLKYEFEVDYEAIDWIVAADGLCRHGIAGYPFAFFI